MRCGNFTDLDSRTSTTQESSRRRRSGTAGALFACGLVLVSLVLERHAPPVCRDPAECIREQLGEMTSPNSLGETRRRGLQRSVRFAGQEQLNALATPQHLGSPLASRLCRLVPATREVLCSRTISIPVRLWRAATSVHELVHPQQFGQHAHERAPCLAEECSEGEAYRTLPALYLDPRRRPTARRPFLLRDLGMFGARAGTPNDCG